MARFEVNCYACLRKFLNSKEQGREMTKREEKRREEKRREEKRREEKRREEKRREEKGREEKRREKAKWRRYGDLNSQEKREIKKAKSRCKSEK